MEADEFIGQWIEQLNRSSSLQIHVCKQWVRFWVEPCTSTPFTESREPGIRKSTRMERSFDW